MAIFWKLSVAISIIGCGGIPFRTSEETVHHSNGTKTVTVRDGGDWVEHRTYNADDKLIRRSWSDFGGGTHTDDYDPESGDVIRSQ